MYKYITVAYNKTVKYINVYVYIYSRDERRKEGRHKCCVKDRFLAGGLDDLYLAPLISRLKKYFTLQKHVITKNDKKEEILMGIRWAN